MVNGSFLKTQNEKNVRKIMEMDIVKDNATNFVRLKEKLRCFSMDVLAELQEQ